MPSETDITDITNSIDPNHRRDSKSPILFQSKLQPPSSTSFHLERPRLLQMIKGFQGAKLVLVHGPAGCGKTTLMSRVFHCCENQGASWLTVDEADNDDGRFMSYLLAALGNPLVRSPGEGTNNIFKPVDIHNETVSLVLTQVGHLSEGYSLFFDDFEVIKSEASLDLLHKIIQVLPPGVKIIIGTRAIPGIPLGRLRAYGQLLEIQQDNLRFTREETEQFFENQKMGFRIDNVMIDHLLETTEGWITALQLVALSLKSCRDSTAFIRDFSGTNQELADYLAEDLLASQPKEIRDFLLQSSILETIDANVCNAICQRDDSAEILKKLVQANLFISSIDEKREFYRYHNLFRDFLQQQLNFYYPKEISRLHKAAAYWYETHQRPAAAIKHARASGDMEMMAELVNDKMEAFFFDGRLATVIGWLDSLPEELLEKYPRMLVYYAWCLVWMYRPQSRIPNLLARLEQPDFLDELDSISRAEAILVAPINKVMQDDFEGSLALCEQSLLSEQDLTYFSLGVLRNIKSLCLLKLDRSDEAGESAKRGRDAHDQCQSIYGQVYSDCFFSSAEIYQGRIQNALTILRDTFNLAKQEEFQRTAAFACASAYLLEVLYIADQIDEVKTLLRDYLPLISQMCLPNQVITAYLTQARIDYQDEGYTRACMTLNTMRQIGQKRNLPRTIANVWGEQARMALLEEDLLAAERYLALAKSSESYCRYERERWIPVEIRLLHLQEQAPEALLLIKKELRYAKNNKKVLYVLSLSILLSECLGLLREKRKSQQELIKAVCQAAKEGIYRPFIDNGQAIFPLLQECRALYPDKIPEDFYEHIRSSVTTGADESQNNNDSLENLTEREFDILKQLALGKNNQAICNTLCLSLATVKTHLRNINSKLHATNRTEAVAIARQHHLVN